MPTISNVVGQLSVSGNITKQGSITRVNGDASTTHNLVEATTTDATPTTVATFPVPPSGGLVVVTLPVGVQSDGSNIFAQGYTANSAARNGTGAPTLSDGARGAVNLTMTNTFLVPRPSIGFVVSGNDLLLQVTGKAGTTIKWAIEYRSVARA